MADEEDLENELSQLDAEEPSEGDDGVEEGADASEHPGGGEEGDDEPGTGEQGGAKADQSQGSTDQPLTRGQTAQARLRKELQETREKALTHERELQEIKARLAQATQPQGETPQARQARLDQMTTEERLTYLLQESEWRANQQRQYDQFQTNDRYDQQAYQARMATDKRAAKYQPEVEQVLRDMRQQGLNPKREAVYAYVLGLKILNAKQTKGQTTGVARRQAAQQTRPATTGGDVGRGQRTKSLEQKLDGVLL